FLAARLGAPISTTHAIAGALAGTGLLAAGPHGVRYATLLHSVALPLLFSPVLAMAGTLALFPLAERLVRSRDCICLTESQAPALVDSSGRTGSLVGLFRWVEIRWSHTADCMTGTELVRARISEGLHWLSAASISFARGLNDTPKIVALALMASGLSGPDSIGAGILGSFVPGMPYVAVSLAMALGGIVGARRVAETISRRITPFDPPQALSANFFGAMLVGFASHLGLPVSTTHVAVGSVLGVGLHRRREANWGKAREIAGGWLITLPVAAVAGAVIYWILGRQQ
ncbi:MAG TPA: inorganic phosphate transporter, partial [Candidatus Acidoferrales bacterium]